MDHLKQHPLLYFLVLCSITLALSWIITSYQFKAETDFNKISFILSAFGTFLTIFGFIATFIQLLSVKRLSKLTAKIAKDTRSKLSKTIVITDFSEILGKIETIKNYQRNGQWHYTPERYTDIRRGLTSISVNHPSLTNEERKILQQSKGQFSIAVNRVERGLAEENFTNADRHDLNRILSKQQDKLVELYETMRMRD